jgi:hypothetical protein
MEEKLTELRGIVHDYVRMRNIKRATVIDIGQLLTPSAGQSGYLHEEEIWGRQDPVHLTTKGYSMVAAGLESLIYEERGDEREAEEKESQGPSKKPRYDAPESRPAWVKGSVAEASGKEGEGGSRGHPSSIPGEVATRPEAVEDVPTTEKGLVEIARTTTTTDPDTDSPVAGAAARGGATEPLEARTVASDDSSERPAPEQM